MNAILDEKKAVFCQGYGIGLLLGFGASYIVPEAGSWIVLIVGGFFAALGMIVEEYDTEPEGGTA